MSMCAAFIGQDAVSSEDECLGRINLRHSCRIPEKAFTGDDQLRQLQLTQLEHACSMRAIRCTQSYQED